MLRDGTGLPRLFMDEHLTTLEAERTLIEKVNGAKTGKIWIDSMKFILQDI